MNKAQSIVLKICKYVVFSLFGILVAYFFIIGLFGSCTIGYTDEHVFYLKDFPVLLLGGLGVLVLILAILRYKIKPEIWNRILDKKILFVITVIWFALLIGWIFMTLETPIYDQNEVFLASKGLLNKDYSRWEYGMYMYVHAHQNGMALCYVLFHLLFSDYALLAVAFLNLLCWYGAICGVARLSFLYFKNQNITKIVYLGLLCFIPAWGYITFIYGTLPSLFLCVWAVNMEKSYEDSGKLKYAFFASLFLFIAIMWKQNSYIWAIGIGIMFLLDTIRMKRKKSLIALLFVVVFVLAEWFIVPFTIQQITGTETNHGLPALAYVAIGLNESNIAPGWFNEFALKMGRDNGYIKESMNAASLEEIRNRIQIYMENPEYGIRFFGRKLNAMWNSPDFEGALIINRKNYNADFPYWVKDIIYNGGVVNTILFLLEDAMQSIYTCGIVLYLIFDRKKLDLRKACPMILLIGGFIFHFFWEGKTQYAFPYYVLLFPYAVKGFHGITLYLKEKWESTDKKYWKDAEIRILGVLLCLITAIGISNSTLVNSTIKLGVDTADYIYYCQNEIQWKHPEYHRSDDLDEMIEMNNLKEVMR